MAELTKPEILKIIEQMPEDASIHDVLYQLYVCAEIEDGLADMRAGRTIPHEEVIQGIEEWLQSAGR